MISLRNTLFTLCVIIASAVGNAQTSIDKIVESLEHDKNAQEIMYTEQRNPQTHKIIKSSRLIQFSSEKILAKLIIAFKKERSKAVSYRSSVTPNSSVYSILFNDNNGYSAKYDLYQETSTRWVLSISIYRARKTNDSSAAIDGFNEFMMSHDPMEIIGIAYDQDCVADFNAKYFHNGAAMSDCFSSSWISIE